MKKYILSFSLLLVLPSLLYAQTGTVINPVNAQFTPSTDQNIVENGVSLLSSYELRIYAGTSTTPIAVLDLGKPVPDASNTIVVSIATLVSNLSVGTYVGRVAAKGPGGETLSAVSNPFQIVVRAPNAPTSVIFTK